MCWRLITFLRFQTSSYHPYFPHPDWSSCCLSPFCPLTVVLRLFFCFRFPSLVIVITFRPGLDLHIHKTFFHQKHTTYTCNTISWFLHSSPGVQFPSLPVCMDILHKNNLVLLCLMMCCFVTVVIGEETGGGWRSLLLLVVPGPATVLILQSSMYVYTVFLICLHTNIIISSTCMYLLFLLL